MERAEEYLKSELENGSKLVKDLCANEEFKERVLEKAAVLLGVLKQRDGVRGPMSWALKKRNYKFAKPNKEPARKGG